MSQQPSTGGAFANCLLHVFFRGLEAVCTPLGRNRFQGQRPRDCRRQQSLDLGQFQAGQFVNWSDTRPTKLCLRIDESYCVYCVCY
jgi:hypothetical protein